MSDIKRFTNNSGCMLWERDGEWVRYDDHQAEIGRLTGERDEAHVTIRLLRMSNGACPKLLAEVRANVERLTHERDEARAEVERLKAMLPPTAHTGVRNGPGEGSWSVFAGKVVEERDEAQAEVQRLIAERDEAQSESVRLKTERDEQKRQNYQVVYECDALVYSARRRAEKATAERDEARAEVQRLIAERDQAESGPKGREVGRFGLDGHYLDAMEPARPSDEDIWREVFLRCVSEYITGDKRVIIADTMLAEYRKRWPR